jgi:hypothetical protein
MSGTLTTANNETAWLFQTLLHHDCPLLYCCIVTYRKVLVNTS